MSTPHGKKEKKKIQNKLEKGDEFDLFRKTI